MCGNLKFTYEALNQTMSNQTALMRSMQRHTRPALPACYVRSWIF